MFIGVGTALNAVRAVLKSFITDSLKAFYPFKNNSANLLLDGSTSFDGSNDYVCIGQPSSLNFGSGDLSISFWVKGIVNDDIMISRYVDGSNKFLIQVTGNTLLFYVKQSGTLRVDIRCSLTPNEGQWYHIGATLQNGVEGCLYIDGQKQTLSTNTIASGSTDVSADLDLSKYSTAYYKLTMANLGFWSRALSASEMESIYWRGSYSELESTELTNLVSWYNLNSSGISSTELITNGTMELDANWDDHYSVVTNERSSTYANSGTYSRRVVHASSGWQGIQQSSIPVKQGATYRLEYYIYGVTGTSHRIGFSSGIAYATEVDGTAFEMKSVTHAIGSWTKFTFDIIPAGTGTANGVLYIRNTGTSFEYYVDDVSMKLLYEASDSAGSNGGAIIGATTNTNSYSGQSPFKPRALDIAKPKMAVQLADGSTSFDGSDDYVDCGTGLGTALGDNYSGSLTVSLWFKADTYGDDGMFNLTSFSSSVGEFNIVASSAHGIRFGLNGDAWYRRYTFSDTSSWHHIACVYDTSGESSSLIYLDGMPVSTATNGSFPADADMDFSGLKTIIGAYHSTSYTFDGSIANVAIHSSALSQSQIQSLMFAEKYAGLSTDLKTNLVSWYDMGSTNLGSDLVDDLINASNWSAYGSNPVSVVDSSIQITYADHASGAYVYLRDSKGLTTDLTVPSRYKITFDAKYTGGSAGVQVVVNNGSGNTNTSNLTTSFVNYEIEFSSANATSGHIKLSGLGASNVVNIKNIVLKEIQIEDKQGSNEGSLGNLPTINTGYTHSPHGVVDPINYGIVKSGSCLHFDGSNDVVNTGDTFQSTFRDSFSISFWTKPDDGNPSGNQMFFGAYTSDNSDGIQMYLDSSPAGALHFNYKSDGTSTGAETDNAIFTDGSVEWKHIVGIVQSSGISIYVNGVVQALDSTSNGSMSGLTMGSYTTDQNLRIGARVFSSSESVFYDGKINNFKIFSTALSEAQIQELYTNPEMSLPTGVSSSNLKAEYLMQEGGGSHLFDSSGNNKGATITGASWAYAEEDGYQKSLVRSNTPMIFDGSNDYLRIDDTNTNLGQFGILDKDLSYSVATWIYMDALTACTVWSHKSASGDRVGLNIADNGNMAHEYFDGSSYTAKSGAISAKQWYHIVCTNTAGTLALYINGSAQSGTTALQYLSNVALNEFQIGFEHTGTSRFFQGIIADVAIWDTVLTASAVTALYNSGSQILPTSDSGNYDKSSHLVNYWRNEGNVSWSNEVTAGTYGDEHWDNDYSTGTGGWTAKGTNYLTNDNGAVKIEYNSSGGHDDGAIIYLRDDHDLNQNPVVGKDYKLTFEAKATVVNPFVIRLKSGDDDAQDITLSSTTTEFQSYSYTFRNQTLVDTLFRLNGMGAGEIAWIRNVSLKRYTSAPNTSYTAYGSPSRIVLPETLTEGRDNQGLLLKNDTLISNGVRLFGNEYIHIADSEILDFVGDYSVEFWVKPKTMASNTRLVTKGETGTGEWMISTGGDGTQIRVYAKDDGNNAKDFTSTNTVPAGIWTHIVVIFNISNDSIDVYKNGGNLSQGTSAGWSSGFTSTKEVRIGVNSAGNGYYDGLVDEVKTYNKALSATEILKNYNSGKSLHS